MSHLTMDFGKDETAAGVAANASMFSLTCRNNSMSSWVFYMYQTMPNQMPEVFSLAWFASPYRIAPGTMITFTWQTDHCFVWGNTGMLVPGVTFMASQVMPCDPNGANATTFSMDDNTPQFSTPVNGSQPNSLSITAAASVPNGIFSTGIGMSGQATFIQPARPNMRQLYVTPPPTYWIAAASQMQMGAVLSDSDHMAARVNFQPGNSKMTATLNPDNTWIIY